MSISRSLASHHGNIFTPPADGTWSCSAIDSAPMADGHLLWPVHRRGTLCLTIWGIRYSAETVLGVHWRHFCLWRTDACSAFEVLWECAIQLHFYLTWSYLTKSTGCAVYAPVQNVQCQIFVACDCLSVLTADDYYVAGMALSVSVVNEGPAPAFLSTELFRALTAGPESVTVTLDALLDSSFKTSLTAVCVFHYNIHYHQWYFTFEIHFCSFYFL